MTNTVEDPNHDPNLYSEIDVSYCTPPPLLKRASRKRVSDLPESNFRSMTIRWAESEVENGDVIRFSRSSIGALDQCTSGDELLLNVAPGFYTLAVGSSKGYVSQKICITD